MTKVLIASVVFGVAIVIIIGLIYNILKEKN